MSLTERKDRIIEWLYGYRGGDTRPGKGLRFDPNKRFVHMVCGGEAERSEPPYRVAACRDCDRTVPWKETKKA